jgi:hypothetical protein
MVTSVCALPAGVFGSPSPRTAARTDSELRQAIGIAERTSARACASRAAATWMLVFLRSARSIRSSSAGSPNDFHQAPRVSASAGLASVHLPSPSLKAAGVAGNDAGSMTGAAEHPAMRRAAKEWS